MKVRSLHSQFGSHWRPLRSISWLLTMAGIIAAAGCTGGSAEDTSDTDPVVAEEPAHPALRNGVFATPQAVGGSSADGVGVFLSAVGDTAELTLYVVAPARSATFVRPALYLTTQEAEHSKTEVAEFEDVTMQAGESRVLREQADGTLLEVFADFAGAGTGEEG
jgi:hypothetical protein